MEALVSNRPQVLVIEDDPEIRELMALLLLRQGYQVRQAQSSEEALVDLRNQNADLVVLDWMLPGLSGVEFLTQAQSRQKNFRVLMVTAKSSPEDIVRGLEEGADDYLTKPFDSQVFLARVRALLRRKPAQGSSSQSQDILELRGLKINLASYEVKLRDEDLHLTPSEFKLLATMLENQGRVLTRDQLIEKIQGEGVNVVGRTIDTHVFGLRKKLGDWGEHVETIRGIGYRVRED